MLRKSSIDPKSKTFSAETVINTVSQIVWTSKVLNLKEETLMRIRNVRPLAGMLRLVLRAKKTPEARKAYSGRYILIIFRRDYFARNADNIQ